MDARSPERGVCGGSGLVCEEGDRAGRSTEGPPTVGVLAVGTLVCAMRSTLAGAA
jgi:hypothetical protein